MSKLTSTCGTHLQFHQQHAYINLQSTALMPHTLNTRMQESKDNTRGTLTYTQQFLYLLQNLTPFSFSIHKIIQHSLKAIYQICNDNMKTKAIPVIIYQVCNPVSAYLCNESPFLQLEPIASFSVLVTNYKNLPNIAFIINLKSFEQLDKVPVTLYTSL